MPEKPVGPREYGYYISVATVGMEMAACIGLGLVLDHYFAWSPWGVIGGAVIGLTAGIAHLATLANRREDSNTKGQRDRS